MKGMAVMGKLVEIGLEEMEIELEVEEQGEAALVAWR